MEQASVLYMNNMSPSRMSIHPKIFPPAAGTHMYPPVFRFSKIHLNDKTQNPLIIPVTPPGF